MDLEEKLAELCHEHRVKWMTRLFSMCKHQAEPPWTISVPFTTAFFWRKQMDTPYSELSESEKEPDRELAKKVSEVFAKYQESLDNAAR